MAFHLKRHHPEVEYSSSTEPHTTSLTTSKKPYLSITTDGWTSRATERFVTITAQFVKHDWAMGSCVLQTRPLHEAHTGTNIGQVIKDATIAWKLERSHGWLSVTTDNARNMGIAVTEALPSPHICCFVHVINLATQKGLQVAQMSRLLGKVRRIVGFYHRSSIAAAILKEKQNMLQLPDHKLIQDVATRWNSLFDMIERYLEQQGAVVATLLSLKNKEKDINTLTDDDASNMEALTLILKPLKTITTFLCDEKLPTILVILPLLDRLQSCLTHSESDSGFVKSVKVAISDNLSKRYLDPDCRRVLLMSSFLDPRFKQLPNEDPECRLQVSSSIIHETAKVNENHGSDPVNTAATANVKSTCVEVKEELDEVLEPPCKKSALDDLFGHEFATAVEVPATTLIEKAVT